MGFRFVLLLLLCNIFSFLHLHLGRGGGEVLKRGYPSLQDINMKIKGRGNKIIIIIKKIEVNKIQRNPDLRTRANTDTSLFFALGNESPFIFSKFNPLNTDIPLIKTLSLANQCPC